MSFAQLNLNDHLHKALKACGYTEPTSVQAKSIPAILAGNDLVACAQTGTGKTAAFVLPALQRLSMQKPSKTTRILILTPTRELAAQITKAASLYGKFLKFNIVSLVGGMPYHHQIKDLARGADIIVATPGRLLDHIESKRVDLSHVEMLVLDEADRMLDMGFIDDVTTIAKLTPEQRQTLLFSATIDKQLSHVIRHLLKNPIRIDLSNEKISAPKIKQELYRVKNTQHKLQLLKHLLGDKNIYKAIIFSATKMNADRLADQLCDEGFPAAALHGDLRQNVRNRTVEQLRRGKIQFLVATDVAARGLDISDITHVINYDLPRFSEDYVHRIGRTGRAGKSGVAISFVLPTDMRHVQRIERYIDERLPLLSHLQMDTHAGSGSEQKINRQSNQDTSDWNDFNDDDRPKKHHHEKRHFSSDKKRHDERGFSSRKKRDGEPNASFEKKRSENRGRPFNNERNERDNERTRTHSTGAKRHTSGDKPFGGKRKSESEPAFEKTRSDTIDKPFSKKRSSHGQSFGKKRGNNKPRGRSDSWHGSYEGRRSK
ncbi:MAG: hypothetical protein ACD_46C00260G0006 [uncultured bacterium]|nr:MAG: hypothetical protein ACD_46C00260G0006 [uncultured bacterium]